MLITCAWNEKKTIYLLVLISRSKSSLWIARWPRGFEFDNTTFPSSIRIYSFLKQKKKNPQLYMSFSRRWMIAIESFFFFVSSSSSSLLLFTWISRGQMKGPKKMAFKPCFNKVSNDLSHTRGRAPFIVADPEKKVYEESVTLYVQCHFPSHDRTFHRKGTLQCNGYT